MPTTLESLPVELIAEVLGHLDLDTLVTVSYLSRRLMHIVSDTSLNPWKRPILQSLASHSYERSSRHLSLRSVVPRSNWIDILTLAPPGFLLFEASFPNLKASEWEECFRRRFLPGWLKWTKSCTWRESYLKMLYRIWHRTHTSCTTDEAWTKYIVLNRSGSVNQLESSSRGFTPMAIFSEMQFQSNLSHLPATTRVVVTFSDIRILAIGVLHTPRSSWNVNHNARAFLNPTGISPTDSSGVNVEGNNYGLQDNPYGEERDSISAVSYPPFAYNKLTHPLPAKSHSNYPLYTPGGGDKRWLGSGSLEEDGEQWDNRAADWVKGRGCVDGSGASWNQFASLTWQDLLTIAPWMKDRVTKLIDGSGLGI